VPKETVAIVLFFGLAFGSFWGCLSLVLWSAKANIPWLVVAPLWLTAEIATRVPIHPYLAGAMACALIGALPAALLLVLARARAA
jgi:hypothetical protein